MKKAPPRRMAPRSLSTESLEGMSGSGAGNKFVRFGAAACEVCGYIVEDPDAIEACPVCYPPGTGGGGGGYGGGYGGGGGPVGSPEEYLI